MKACAVLLNMRIAGNVNFVDEVGEVNNDELPQIAPNVPPNYAEGIQRRNNIVHMYFNNAA